MNLSEARPLAECLVAKLRPYCDRIEIAGSIRRGRPDVGDVELVCIPKRHTAGLFGDDYEVNPGFVAEVNKMPGGKGSPEGKYTRRSMKWGASEIGIDIFMTVAPIWGSIFAIRTGSADFSHYVLAKRWTKLKWRSVDGVLIHDDDGERKTFAEEDELFDFLGIEWVAPEWRDVAGEKAKKEYYESHNQQI